MSKYDAISRVIMSQFQIAASLKFLVFLMLQGAAKKLLELIQNRNTSTSETKSTCHNSVHIAT